MRKKFALTRKFPETEVVHAPARTRLPLQARLPPEHWPIWKASPCSPAGPKNVHVGVHPAPVQAQSVVRQITARLAEAAAKGLTLWEIRY